MASSDIPVVGVQATPAEDGSIPIRREVRDMIANFQDQWNIYLLGLREIHKMSPEDILSYYQLAGIHGEPFVPWNGVNGNSSASFGGYCTHSSILFLTWHRPYLALYEQVLYAKVNEVASQYSEPQLRTRYVAAAINFRMPYWDWAARTTGGSSAFPSAIRSPTVTVVDIDGVSKQINNPLYRFDFSDLDIPADLALDSYWSQFPTTLRAPDSNGNSHDETVSAVITNENASLRNNISILLLSYKLFDAFSNTAWSRNGQAGDYGSIENVHDVIHDQIGDGGHMSSLSVSAFDPVFWLHHTNIDRLWAIWQDLNPRAFAINKVAASREANFTIAAGERISTSTELKPFWDASGTKFWNSNGVKETAPLGYVYPETQSWRHPTTQQYQTALRQIVVNTYGANVLSNFFADAAANGLVVSAAKQETVPEKEVADDLAAPLVAEGQQHPILASSQFSRKAVKQPIVSVAEIGSTAPNESHNPDSSSASSPEPPASSEPTTDSPSDSIPTTGLKPDTLNIPPQFGHLLSPDNTYTEYITNLRALKHGLSQTFRVFVFLGDFNPSPSTWATEPNLVGRFTVLGGRGTSPSTASSCAKCVQDAANNLVVTGTVPLTSALLRDVVLGHLPGLAEDVVGPYLQRHLHWRVQTWDGEEVERESVPGLKVAVVSTDVTIGEGGLPVYGGGYTVLGNVTDGRPAGLCGGDEI